MDAIGAKLGNNLGIGTKSFVGDIIYIVYIYILWLEVVLAVEVVVSAEVVYTVYLEQSFNVKQKTSPCIATS
jgi:hypothetical protein